MRYLIVEKRNSAGFFSDFSLITGSLEYVIRNNIKDFYVVWNNYIYQDQGDTRNLFDEYFFPQKSPATYFDKIVSAHDIGSSLIRPIAEKETVKKFHDALVHFKFFDNPIYKHCESECVVDKNMLGVHVRRTDHFQHGDLLPIEYYWSKIEECIDKYDKLFLATDDAGVVDSFSARYGNKLIHNDGIFRSNNNQAIHAMNHKNKKKIIYDVMKDGISLSKCQELIFTASNVAGFALWTNPNIKFNQIDLHIAHR